MTECTCKNCIDTEIEAKGVCADCYGNGCDQEDGNCGK